MAEQKPLTGLGILLDEKRVNDLLEQKSGAKAMIRSMCNGVLFICFLLLFTALALGEPLDQHRAFEGYIRRRFDTAAAMPLSQVESVSSFWHYMDVSFMPAIYGNDTSRFYFPDHEVERLLQIEDANRLLSVVRLRMLKINPGEACSVKSSLSEYFPTCYGPYSDTALDTEPFGPPNDQTGDPEFAFRSDPLGAEAVGKFMTYPPGGFMEALTANHNETSRRIELMKEEHFLGSGLRAVVLDWSIYNFNIGAYGVCSIIFEVSPSGLWQTSFKVDVLMRRHLNPLGSRTTGDWLNLLGEVVLVLFVLRYILEEASEFIGFRGWRPHLKLDYFSDAWNLLDWLNLILMIVTLVLRIQTWGMSGNIVIYTDDPSKAGVDNFLELNGTAMNIRLIHSIIAFNTVLTWFKAVKYIEVLPYITTLLKTVQTSQNALCTFIIVFGTLFFGFVIAYNTAFGEMNAEFRTPWASFVFLSRSLLGDSNFMVVYNAAPLIGSFLIMFFVALIVLVIVNLFYAIMIRALAEVHAGEDTMRKQSWEQFLEKLEDFANTTIKQLRLEYRFRTCFPGLYARIMSRRKNTAEKEKERDEEMIRRMNARKPDLSLGLGPGDPSKGRRAKQATYSINAEDMENSDNESEVDLGPLRDKKQLSKKGMFGDVLDGDGDNNGDDDDDDVQENSIDDDNEPPPEAVELVIRATEHVVDGIVTRTYAARGVLLDEMNESKAVLLKMGSVLEVLGQRTRVLEAKQRQLLNRF